MENSSTDLTGSEIAIIGMSGRFPGASDLDMFWRNLRDGAETLTKLSDEALLAAGVSPAELNAPNYVKVAPILDNIDAFDAAFFGFSPLEAEITDPQQRVFFECVWEALEDAGYNPDTYDEPFGVFAGSRTNTYVFNIASNPDLFKSLGVLQVSIGNDLASLATKISYKFNLKGPSYAVHTACSTSLVAIHLARQSLLLDECRMAVAGGVAINVPHHVGYLYEPGSVLAPDGQCRAFDAEAQGTIFGSGAGVVLLKRLEDALADGDHIYAVIKGSATNNDGANKASFTAPSVDGQAKVIIDALADAEVEPDTISYVEAHGTGTQLGDPIEVRALTKAFRAQTRRKGFCAIGSVKTNIGHLDAAAGISSLIKTVLALKHGQLPPTLHFTAPNPRIDFANSPFYVNTKLTDWVATDGPRRAGVSSFGFGGTNAHLILEEAPPPPEPGPSRPWQLLPLSARSEPALQQMSANLARHLRRHPDSSLADIAYTLQVGRKLFEYRHSIVCQTHEQAIAALENSDSIDDLQPQTSVKRPVVFMFPGQGSQYAGMAHDLYLHEPIFREHVDRCAQLLRSQLGLDLRDLLFPKQHASKADAALADLNQTAYAQPALFVVEYALAQLWISWGIQPQAMIGHSVGEYVAACLAGVFSLEDALQLVAARGRLMQSLPAGAMLSVTLPEVELRMLLGSALSLAAVNATGSSVVSGPEAEIAALERRLLDQEIPCRRLHTSHAFHSAMMDPILDEFLRIVRRARLQPPQMPYSSNLTGTWITPQEATDPQYWVHHLRQTVRFAAGLDEVIQQNRARVLLEVGPGTTLSSFARKHPDAALILASLRHPQDQRSDSECLMTALGQLWQAGVPIDWPQVSAHETRGRVSLPTYPFERQRYWIDPLLPLSNAAGTTTGLGKRADVGDWFYQPIWQQAALENVSGAWREQRARWLIFRDECGVSDQLIERLSEAQQEVITVTAGAQFAHVGPQAYTIDPGQSADYHALLGELQQLPATIIHAWSVTPDAQTELTSAAFEEVQSRGFYSLLFLSQALSSITGSSSIQLHVISNHVQAVTGDEPLNPAKATLLGPCKVIPQEQLIPARSIDLAQWSDANPADQIELLLAEITTPSGDTVVAYRDGSRWVQSFAELPEAHTVEQPPRLRTGGVYLITGGLGGLGLMLTRYLAQEYQAKLVLTARTALPDRATWAAWLEEHDDADPISTRLRTIQALEAAGAQVLVRSADAGNLEQMRTVIAEGEQLFGPINGVFHAAGITSDHHFSSIPETSPAQCALHFQPKAHGLIVLETLLRDHSLDFCMLFSSLASVLGGLSYVAYSAANIFMDAFAYQQHQRSNTPWISVDWDSWHADALDADDSTVGVTLVELAILPHEGLDAIRRILALEPRQQVVISTSELQPRIDQWIRLNALRDTSAGGTARKLPARNDLEKQLVAIWQRVLGVSRVGLHDNFFDLGGNSLSGMQLLAELKRELDLQLSPVALFEAPTVSALATLILPAPTAELQTANVAAAAATSEIAIIGMSGRFPGASDVDSFWQNLSAGVESITFFSDDELATAGVPAAHLRDPNYVKARPILDDIAAFDAGFFGYSPREATLMDPQHRVFLESAWHALEIAGYPPMTHSDVIGVYAGASLSTYLLNLYSNLDLIEATDPLQTAIGNAQDSLTTSVSYKLNLKGPSLAVQTFCSTSLVAVHLACQSLLLGECDLALAGGVSILVPQQSGYRYQDGSILSPDGHCRAFDAQAAGTLFGNGVGVVVLKRLEHALRDGDTIHAVIKGSAINNDGAIKVGYTAPSVDGQAQVIASALASAGVSADNISYIEAHGTGTALGDPIEIAALTKAFRASTDAQGFCAIGSVKTNIGHLDRAAGAAALIKTVLALKHQQLPPSLHYSSPNPAIDFANSPFFVNTSLREWTRNGTPRRAGVSALGFGGTNAHVIVEEAPEIPPTDAARPWQLLLLSAKTPAALDTATAQLHSYLQQRPDINLADVAYTLQVGRTPLPHRRALVCRDYADALELLAEREPGRIQTANVDEQSSSVAFLFPGQGAQYVGMGQELYVTQPVFHDAVDHCCELLKPHLGLDLREILYPEADAATSATEQLTQTVLAQPALFVIEYALAQLWQSWGVVPAALLGHSTGEYVAACLAGVMTLDDALALVAIRGRLLQALPAGAMLAIPLAEQAVQSLIDPSLSIAAVNAPTRCVVSGPIPAIDKLEQQLSDQGIKCRRLHTSHAFHSPMVEPILNEFAAEMRKIALQRPQIPFVSNVTGTWITEKEATDPGYWVRHLRQTVYFAAGVATLLKETNQVLLEVGPGHSLSTLAKQQIPLTHELTTVHTLPHPDDPRAGAEVLLTAAGRLWLAGVPLAWTALHAQTSRRRIPLPGYPFERQHYWIEAQTPQRPSAGQEIVLDERGLHPWFYLPSWKRSHRTPQLQNDSLSAQQHRWLIFLDAAGIGAKLAERLADRQQQVILVEPGAQYRQVDANRYTLRPHQSADYSALLGELQGLGHSPSRIVHAWSITDPATSAVDWDSFEAVQKLGFASLLALTHALRQQPGAQPLHVWVVSNNLHEVSGEEDVSPAKAAILGACQSISQAYPHIACHNIDVVVPAANAEKLVAQLLAEISAESDELIVAYRGAHRWLPTLEPMPRDEQPLVATRIKPGGVYMLADGFSSTGLQTGEYLARSAGAKLVLVEPTPMPPSEAWPQWLAGDDEDAIGQQLLADARLHSRLAFDLAAAEAAMRQFERDIADTLPIAAASPGVEAASNQLCAASICAYFSRNGIQVARGASYSKAALLKTLGILPKFERFYDYMLSLLHDNAIIAVEAEQITFLKDAAEIGAPETLTAELEQHYPELRTSFQLMSHCVNHYDRVLTGDLDAISVLYPDGNTDMVHLIEESQLRFSNIERCRAVVSEVLSRIVREEPEPGRPLRILEVGGGEGGLTWEIMAALDGQPVEYHFTDIGKSFVNAAQKHALQAGITTMRFGVLDISRDPAAQGYDLYSFDAIVASEVVHATSSIVETLDNLKRLLRPQGILCILEATKTQKWASMVWGLLDGWWNFTDHALRRYSPLLSAETWSAVLDRQQFQHLHQYPQMSDEQPEYDYSVLIVQQPATIDVPSYAAQMAEAAHSRREHVRGNIRAVQSLEAAGAEVLVAQADLADVAALRAVLEQAERRFGRVDGLIHAPEPVAASHADDDLDPVAYAASVKASTQRFHALHEAARNTALDVRLAIAPLAPFSAEQGHVLQTAVSWLLHTTIQSWREAGWTGVNWGLQNGHTPDVAAVDNAFERLLALPTPQVVVSAQRLNDEWHQLPVPQSGGDATVTAALPLFPRPHMAQPFVAPSNETEYTIARIWEQILGVAQVGINDSFLDFGGDSLQASQMLSRVRDTFGMELPMRQFFEAPTVAGMAKFIAGQQADQEADQLDDLISLIQQLSPEDLMAEIQKRRSTLEQEN